MQNDATEYVSKPLGHPWMHKGLCEEFGFCHGEGPLGGVPIRTFRYQNRRQGSDPSGSSGYVVRGDCEESVKGHEGIIGTILHQTRWYKLQPTKVTVHGARTIVVITILRCRC